MKSRKQQATPNESTLNYWYKSALEYIKKNPLKSRSQLDKLAEDFSLYACREYYGYLGPVPKTKLKATKDIILGRLEKSTIVKNQIGIGSIFLAR
jgi:hypothetical protein